VASFRTATVAPASAAPWTSETTPPIVPRSERWARREGLDPRLRHTIRSAGRARKGRRSNRGGLPELVTADADRRRRAPPAPCLSPAASSAVIEPPKLQPSGRVVILRSDFASRGRPSDSSSYVGHPWERPVGIYDGKFMRRRRSWKRGSERSGSRAASTFM
jgi:hypothetical protein